LKLRSRSISISGTRKELAVMKVHQKFASVMERDGARMA
jgi:hypothetical protein